VLDIIQASNVEGDFRKATLAKAKAEPDEHEFWDDVERYADRIA